MKISNTQNKNNISNSDYKSKPAKAILAKRSTFFIVSTSLGKKTLRTKLRSNPTECALVRNETLETKSITTRNKPKINLVKYNLNFDKDM